MLCLLRPGSLVYEQLGYKAFGIPGKLAASCSITMQNFGGTTSKNSQIFLFFFLNHLYLLPANVQISSDILVWAKMFLNSLSISAMASYLYIVKYELPIVIKAFLDSNDK